MNPPPMPIATSYSTASADELLAKIVCQYPIDNPQSCVFWQRGVNDTYEVRCSGVTYSLRVYRAGLRTRDAVEFELASINYLHQQGASVAWPIEKHSGGYVSEIDAPEGLRYVIITAYAEGERPRYNEPDDAREFGKSAATLHQLSEGFNTSFKRPDLDVSYLLDESLEIVLPHMSHRAEDVAYLEQAAETARKAVSAISPENLDTGFCHGDFHGGNVHKSGEVLTHFDFDCCGFGLRIFDLATFKWSAMLRDKQEQHWPPFLEGYQSVRAFGANDLALLDTFVFIRHVWLMALHMGNADDFGHGVTSDGYIDHQLGFIRKQLGEDADEGET